MALVAPHGTPCPHPQARPWGQTPPSTQQQRFLALAIPWHLFLRGLDLLSPSQRAWSCSWAQKWQHNSRLTAERTFCWGQPQPGFRAFFFHQSLMRRRSTLRECCQRCTFSPEELRELREAAQRRLAGLDSAETPAPQQPSPTCQDQKGQIAAFRKIRRIKKKKRRWVTQTTLP